MRHVLDPKRLSDLGASDTQRPVEIGSAIRALRGYTARPAEAEVEALARRLDAQLAAPTAIGAGSAAFGLGAKWIATLVLAAAIGFYAIGHRDSKMREAPRPDAAVVKARPLATPPVVSTTPPAMAPDVPAPPVAKSLRHEHTHVAARAVPSRAGASPEAELALLKQAQTALDREPSAALALAERHALLYPRGLFTQEREILAIEALLKLRQRPLAIARAKDFAERYPDSPHARRVRSLLERSQVAVDETIAPASDHSATDTQR